MEFKKYLSSYIGKEQERTQEAICNLLLCTHKKYRHTEYEHAYYFNADNLKDLGLSLPTFHKLNEKYELFSVNHEFSHKHHYGKAYFLREKWKQIIADYANKLVPIDRDELPPSEFDHPNLIRLIPVNPHGGDGWISHEINKLRALNPFVNSYRRVENGRIYGVGPNNVQYLPKRVRKVLFKDYPKYDITNCHYTLLSQMGNFPYIESYVNQTKEFRTTLAEEFDVTISKIKQAILALLYGARTPHHEGTLYKDCFRSNWKTKTFLDHDLIKGIIGELNSIELKPTELSNLLLGYESKILLSVLNERHMLVPLHDGWIQVQRDDPAELEQLIRDRTGFDVKLEEE